MSKIWTKEEEVQLIELYPVKGINFCVSYFGRSQMAVQKKAGRLGLKAPGLHTSKGSAIKSHSQYLEELLCREIDAIPVEQYEGAKTPILHECFEGHRWAVSPDNLLRGKGCCYCNKHGFQLDKPAIVYYIKIGDYYKVGVTNKTVTERFYKDRDKPIEILREEYFDLGSEALLREQSILSKYASHRVTIKGYLKSRGETELFESPVWL